MRKIEVIRARREHLKQQEQHLLSEIHYLQQRLKQMGYNGDCAYERAIENNFQQRLVERRRALSELTHQGRLDSRR